ncbi:MAG TPA: alpha/beta fold hydrolase [Anaerolineae bacterium]|nr:alpha/beta fold hydrolase [Anaerolineae bacterium]
MKEMSMMPGAEAFFFEGSEVGVLASHGFTGTTQSMRFVAEYLAQEGGCTVIGPCLKGHGTTPEDMATTTAEDWIRCVEESLDTLQARCSKIFITGLSMGGTLTLYIAAMHADVIAGAIPINGAVFVNSPDMASLAFMQGAPPSVPGVGSDIKKEGVTELVYPVVPVPAIRQLYALMAVTRELLPRVTCPTLIFQSRDDHVVVPDNAPYILENIGAAEKRLVWLEDSYHVATQDNDKELIAAETLRFIQAHV